MTKQTIAFEIGTEELPAIELHNVTGQLEKTINGEKGKLFDHDSATVYTTPRRLIVVIKGVPEKIEACTEEYKGPKESIAYADGKPTKAAIGFARGKGLAEDDLEIREIDGEKYVYAVKNIPEKNISDLLPELFLNLIKNINWKKTQRWGSQTQAFARPIRWIFAMFGDKVFDVEYAGVKSGNVTFGHRFLAPGPYQLKNADELITQLEKSFVVLTESEREDIIRQQVAKIEDKTGLKCQLNPATLQEVVNLCEYPTAMVGKFDKSFLQVPKEIIVDAMLVHQRYFPLFDKSENLTNNFIIVSNGDPANQENIVDGNQRVVAARLYDAKFFFEEDKKIPLEGYFDKLDDVVFQEKLGTMKDKGERVSSLSEFIASDAGCASDVQKQASRAGKLCKCDLVTNAVVEFTSVQGIMGMYYAQACGEDEAVSVAIGEHYKPKFAGDTVPSNDVGKCVAAADKIDTLCGMFAVDMLPTGSSDPFALRRGAIGVLSIISSGLNFSLTAAINKSLDLLSEKVKFNRDEAYTQVIDFILTRAKVMLKDDGYSHDTIEAVASINISEPYYLVKRVHALEDARKNNNETFDDLATAFARANNLREAKLGVDFNKADLSDPEINLVDSIETAKTSIQKLITENNYSGCLDELAKLREPIDNFFENVMIMDDDESVRDNRLKILNSFVSVFSDIADFGKMAKSKK